MVNVTEVAGDVSHEIEHLQVAAVGGRHLGIYVTEVAGISQEIEHLQASAVGGRHLGIRDGGGRRQP